MEGRKLSQSRLILASLYECTGRAIELALAKC